MASFHLNIALSCPSALYGYCPIFLGGEERIHWEFTSDPLSIAMVSFIRFDLEPELL